ncbi:esterase-like activity of phytase family protein [Actibacterium sp. XHP0104]|uniref:esterase-like activity of phytase family protein n=1 Tax=Actibacterium sp. XHP0104 TaxID=2984335 RepID=UPI0021E78FB1|nr:esterase-like activity of phytase family protein [Actibacterium sp. XHP0104]MCV2881754.1 esterase-like activity of phytase family protein [Actibacterium sp. XHP0104]
MRACFVVALIAALWAGGATAQALTQTAYWEWQDDRPGFGGFSGLEVSADGTEFTAISDAGFFLTGRFSRAGDMPLAVRDSTLGPMQNILGTPVDAMQRDAEGLAIAEDDTVYVSFELDARVWRYGDISGPPEYLPMTWEFRGFNANQGLEALAIDPDGALFVIPEVDKISPRSWRVFVFRDGAWSQILHLPKRDGFRPVGADFGPDGWFYLLERDFHGARGFSSRIRRWQLGEDGFAGEEVLMTSQPGQYDNLEGLAAWRDEDGKTRLIAISDDNYKFFQRTEFVEFTVNE